MKSVMLSIKPYWLFLIIAEKMGWKIGKKKTIEVRKNYPKSPSWNKSVILYCTKDYNSLNKVPKEYRPLMRLMLGKVIGAFVCDFINKYTAKFVDDDCYESIWQIWEDDDFTIVTSNKDENPNNCFLCNVSCLSFKDIKKYIGVNYHEIPFYGWHISDLEIYDKPKELSEFRKPELPTGLRYENDTIKRPFQSWGYVEELK